MAKNKENGPVTEMNLVQTTDVASKKPRTDNMAVLGITAKVSKLNPIELHNLSGYLDQGITAGKFTEKDNALHLAKFYRSKFKYMAGKLEKSIANGASDIPPKTKPAKKEKAAKSDRVQIDPAKLGLDIQAIAAETAKDLPAPIDTPISATEEVLPQGPGPKRITLFKNLAKDAWYGKIYSTLSAAETKAACKFITDNSLLTAGEFELAVNRMFLNIEASEYPKHWKEMSELLVVANLKTSWLTRGRS